MSDKKSRKEIGDKFLTYYWDIANETDRGSVIITAVILEETLKEILEKRLLPSAEKNDELFDSPYAPLSNFSAKIDIAYRMSLIRDHIRATLHLVRKIRNDFAHKKIKNGFEANSVKSRINELFKLNKNILDAHWDVLKDVFIEKLNLDKEKFENISGVKPLVEILNWRGTFNLLAATTCVGLIWTIEDIEPLPPLVKVPEVD